VEWSRAEQRGDGRWGSHPVRAGIESASEESEVSFTIDVLAGAAGGRGVDGWYGRWRWMDGWKEWIGWDVCLGEGRLIGWVVEDEMVCVEMEWWGGVVRRWDEWGWSGLGWVGLGWIGRWRVEVERRGGRRWRHAEMKDGIGLRWREERRVMVR